jgi:hypothetical protein
VKVNADADELLAMLDSFHVTDRALARSRDRARSSNGDAASLAALKKEMRRYFAAVARESISHLADLDRRLDDLYQRQYNAQAERSVAQRRLEAARRVLDALGEGGTTR